MDKYDLLKARFLQFAEKQISLLKDVDSSDPVSVKNAYHALGVAKSTKQMIEEGFMDSSIDLQTMSLGESNEK